MLQRIHWPPCVLWLLFRSSAAARAAAAAAASPITSSSIMHTSFVYCCCCCCSVRRINQHTAADPVRRHRRRQSPPGPRLSHSDSADTARATRGPFTWIPYKRRAGNAATAGLMLLSGVLQQPASRDDGLQCRPAGVPGRASAMLLVSSHCQTYRD